ncbi:putative membrane protein YdbT with pleckstrin-like domain [Halorubrum alkaliphilum]|uniref:Putative membrane protein YdbT with pleckstrin-like domain n=1 Tax=Halorubrum alkaliphilum TaxID=261290 RepID=A0A8T4GF92_9EURY|nr:PH domain-containing protein [Halorubrum alkaliphilum]MBP1922793.1 putative membrane protein YdbT with pleckstrin-like domain [Halorubrum alkaliphilum]
MPSSAAESIALLEGEEIRHDVRPAWSKWGNLLLISVIMSFFLIGLVGLVYVWLARKNHRYIVTNERVVEVAGVLSTGTTEYRISDIRQVQTGQAFVEGLLGQGNIQISTGTMSDIVFDGIPDYQAVANSIRQAQKDME